MSKLQQQEFRSFAGRVWVIRAISQLPPGPDDICKSSQIRRFGLRTFDS